MEDRDHPDPDLAARLFPVTLVAALVPLAVATVRAVRRGWMPVGDNAYFAIRALDVFSTDPPLLGTWTSNSLVTGINANNPGPLYFDLLAEADGVAPGGAGLAVGAAFLNGVSVVGIALLARRRAGPLVGLLATALTATLCWSMGSELLFDPWQPHSMLLPFLAFLMLAWSLASGDVWALPAAVVVGSVLVQTHLSYAILVPALLGWGGGALALHLRRQRRDDTAAWPPLGRRSTVAAVAALASGLLCWAQPLVEQFTSAGDGNLTRLIRTTAQAPEETVGYGRAVQLLAKVVILPAWWVRPTFGRAWLPSPETVVLAPEAAILPSPGLALAAAVGLVVVMAWSWWTGRRRHDRVVTAAVGTAAVAVLAGWVTAGQAPVGLFGLPIHHFRWLWPLGTFTTLAVATGLVRRWRPARPAPPAMVAGVALVALVLSALNLPSYSQHVGPSGDEYAIPVMRDLGRQMAVLEDEGPLLFDPEGERFATPYSAAIMAQLQRRGIPFVVDDAGLVRQLGPARRFTGRNAEAALLYRVGDGVRTAPRGSRRVAIHESLDPSERRELASLRLRLAAHVDARGGIELNRRGRTALAAGDLPRTVRHAEAGAVPADALLASRLVVVMVQRDLLVLEPRWAPRFERYAELQDRFDEQTVALFLRPTA